MHVWLTKVWIMDDVTFSSFTWYNDRADFTLAFGRDLESYV